jgi:hypothetical protein
MLLDINSITLREGDRVYCIPIRLVVNECLSDFTGWVKYDINGQLFVEIPFTKFGIQNTTKVASPNMYKFYKVVH